MGFETGASSWPTRRPHGKRPCHTNDTDVLFLFISICFAFGQDEAKFLLGSRNQTDRITEVAIEVVRADEAAEEEQVARVVLAEGRR